MGDFDCCENGTHNRGGVAIDDAGMTETERKRRALIWIYNELGVAQASFRQAANNLMSHAETREVCDEAAKIVEDERRSIDERIGWLNVRIFAEKQGANA